MQFDFATATRILFGRGSVQQVPAAVRSFGKRPLLVTGSTPGRFGLFSEYTTNFPTSGEPTLDGIRQGLSMARAAGCDVVMAIGGGSAIDTGKAIAALLPNPGDPLRYLEVIGEAQPLAHDPLPFIAIPTTAGTGAEVTRNAVLASPEHRVKVSLRSPRMLAKLAVIDPELTLDVPPNVTAYTGLDALTQLIEPYVSIRANPFTNLFCLEGIRLARTALLRAYTYPQDIEARTQMSYASLLSGLSLANAGLGIVHGFAAAIGGSFHAPHGAICAALLPHATAVNIRALRSRSLPLQPYIDIAQALTGKSQTNPEPAVEWLTELCGQLAIPALRSYGITLADVPSLIEKAARASSTKANPIVLTPDELTEILTLAL